MRNAVRSDDMVVHLNGDDFGVLIEGLNDGESARKLLYPAYRIPDYLLSEELVRSAVGVSRAIDVNCQYC